MSKKRDPLSVVIHYFNTIDLPSAEQAVTMVREIVKSRQPLRPVKKPAPAAAKRKPDAAAAAEPALN
jgi:hypothetical protein